MGIAEDRTMDDDITVPDDISSLDGQVIPSVRVVDGDRIVIENLEIADRQVAETVDSQVDPDEAVRTAIRIGCQALGIASGSLDARTVEDRFTALTTELEKRVSQLSSDVSEQAEGASNAFSEVAKGLLDEEDGSLVAALASFKEKFLGEVGDLFDEDSKTSVVAKFEAAVLEVQKEHRESVAEALAAQKKVVENLIDPHDESSPIGKLNLAMTKQITEVAEAVRTMHRELSADEQAAAAAQQIIDNSTHKGVAFELMLQSVVEPLTEPLGDSMEDKSLELGQLGTKKGDFTVELNTEHTIGASIRYVIEAKDSSLTTPKAKDEIEAGMANRGALAGLLVFAKQEYSPSSLAFKAQGKYAFVVYDRDAGDDSALRLALMWARWMTVRELGEHSEDLDVGRISELIAKGTAAVKTITQIRASHTKAINQLDKSLKLAGKQVDTLEEQLEDVFVELETEISAAESND